MRTANVLKAVVAGIACLLLLVGIGVAGWQFGWWLEEKNVDRKVGIENRNLGTQTAWRDEAKKLINQASVLPEGAPQAAALERQACELIDQLVDTYMTDQLAAFEAANC